MALNCFVSRPAPEGSVTIIPEVGGCPTVPAAVNVELRPDGKLHFQISGCMSPEDFTDCNPNRKGDVSSVKTRISLERTYVQGLSLGSRLAEMRFGFGGITVMLPKAALPDKSED